MMGRRLFLLGALILSSFEATAAAEESKGETAEAEAIDHTIVVGVGGALGVETAGGSAHTGANAMIEWNAVEGWLELEVEASAVTAPGGVEVPVALLVKKPFKLASWAEFMVGVGPEIVETSGDDRGTHVGGELALDFMFWPSRTVGLWLAPDVEVISHDGAEASVGGTGGVMFGY
jgi:hypothetical protein